MTAAPDSDFMFGTEDDFGVIDFAASGSGAGDDWGCCLLCRCNRAMLDLRRAASSYLSASTASAFLFCNATNLSSAHTKGAALNNERCESINDKPSVL